MITDLKQNSRCFKENQEIAGNRKIRKYVERHRFYLVLSEE